MRVLLLFFAGLIGYSGPACADIVRYSLAGQPGNQVSTTAAFADALVTAGVLDRGSGVTPVAAAGSINSSGWSTAGINTTDYYELDFTSAANTLMNVTGFDFRERRSATGIRNFAVRTSTNNFATFTTQYVASVPDSTGNRDHSISLSGLTGLAGGTTVIIRIYGYTSEAAGGRWRLADFNGNAAAGVRVLGTITAVPEPSGLLAFLAPMLALGYHRTRRSLSK